MLTLIYCMGVGVGERQKLAQILGRSCEGSPEVLKYVHTLLEPHSYELTLQGSPRMYLKLTLKTVHCSNAYHRRKNRHNVHF